MPDESYKRSNSGRFAKGNRGGPGRLSAEQRAVAYAAIRDTLTPDRIKIIVASLLKAVIERQDVAAAKLLLDRLLGKPRSESAQPVAMDLPEGLATTSEIAVAAHTLLRAMAAGEIAPEDAQRGAMVVDTARKAVETEELAKRIAELEKRANRRTK